MTPNEVARAVAEIDALSRAAARRSRDQGGEWASLDFTPGEYARILELTAKDEVKAAVNARVEEQRARLERQGLVKGEPAEVRIVPGTPAN